MGATDVINVKEIDAVQRIKELKDGVGVDAAWETAGNPRALQSALYSLRRGGKLVIESIRTKSYKRRMGR